MTAYLEDAAAALGTRDQRERYAAGVLPEEELLALARAELFRRFAGLKRWAGRYRVTMGMMLKHADGCAESDLQFETTEVSELDGSEWATLTAIRELAAVAHPWAPEVAVVTMTHWVTCAGCKAESSRSVAKVSMTWAGRILVREYVL